MDLMRWERPAPVDLWDAFEGLRGEMDRALDALRVPDAAGIFDRSAAPAVDVIETEEEYLVLADVPGLRKEDLELSITGTLLSIKGELREEKTEETRKFLRRDLGFGSFRRTLDLPAQVDPDKVGAELKDGVLSIRLGKREEAKTRQIAVAVK